MAPPSSSADLGRYGTATSPTRLALSLREPELEKVRHGSSHWEPRTATCTPAALAAGLAGFVSARSSLLADLSQCACELSPGDGGPPLSGSARLHVVWQSPDLRATG